MQPRHRLKSPVLRSVIARFVLMFFCCSILSSAQLGQRRPNRSSSSVLRSSFPCLRSWTRRRGHPRVAVLHGPDWILEYSVKPSCLPEREVVFTTEIGKGLILHPPAATTKMWITREQGISRISIVETSGNEKTDLTGVSFATNHECLSRASKTCRIEGGAVLVRID